jgi:hypothetical protein
MNTTDAEKLSLAIVEALKNKGYNQSQIAEMYGVTRQYVSWIKNYYGGTRTPREEVLDHFPFQVPARLQHTSPFRRLRDHGEYVATGGDGMAEDKLRRLESFWKKLRDENLVVEYDPSLPPIKGVSNKGGWAFRQRESGDDDLIIRVNEFTDLTEKGRMIWRLPPEE